MYKTNNYCARAFQQVIDSSIKSLTVIARGHELIINMQNFPEYITDPVMCEMMDDFRTNFK